MNIQQFWSDVLAQRADEIREYFHADAYVNWHCSNEHFTVEEFIRANCEYNGYGVSVGDWDGEVEKIVTADDMIITATRVYPKDRSASFHVTSFIKLKDDKIIAMDEYWADDREAPKWRQDMKIGMGCIKLKRFLVLALVTACLLCTACSNNFAMQNIAIAGWSNTDMNPEYFNLGDFEVDFLDECDEGDIMFRVKDNSVFVQSILDHPALIRQEYNTKQKKVYVFGDSQNYYLLIEHVNDKKQSEYILHPAVSYYMESDGTTYQIPLFDCSIQYDGSVYFHENQDTPKTKNGWQYFLTELSGLPDDYVTIDESEKTVLLSVAIDVNGERIIDHSKKIKIVYQSDENGNYLIASLIEN